MIAYCITNLLNGKQYIGITIQSLSIRWSEHLSRSKHNTTKSAIHSSIKKYGKDNFVIEEIASTKTIEDLKALEVILIAQYNTFFAGYNLTTGGDYSIMHQEVKDRISKSKMGHSVSKETREKLSIHNNRKWKIIYSDGKEVSIYNLKQFCKDRSLDYSNLTKRKRLLKANIINIVKES